MNLRASATTRLVTVILLFLLFWAGGVLSRYRVYHLQTIGVEGEVPFLLESALQYRMTQQVYDGVGIPRHEPRVEAPGGINPRETYTVGAEYVYSAVAKLLPESMSTHQRFRFASVLLFSLSVPLAALWVGLGLRSWGAGLFVGFLLNVSPAFCVRSSGLALSRENLAMPLLVAFLLWETLSRQSPDRRRSWGFAVLAALSMAIAQTLWDLSRYVLALWVVKEWVEFLRGERRGDGSALRLPLCLLGALGAVGVLNPYLRAHGFAASGLVFAVAGLLLARWLVGRRGMVTRKAGMLGGGLVFAAVMLGQWLNPNYQHFSELLMAKLRFLNQKPADPAALTFLQRIMWTPALNSSSWELTKAYFPATVSWSVLCLGLSVLAGWRDRRFLLPSAVGYVLATGLVYVLFFRFHPFLILFLAMLSGVVLSWASGRSRWVRIPLWLVAAIVVATEAGNLFFERTVRDTLSPEKVTQMERLALAGFGVPLDQPVASWGHPHAMYTELRGLVNWLQEHGRDQPVLANFGVSAFILGYAGNPILLHPKFESVTIRERVEAYALHLFRKPELEFRDWAVAQGAVFFVLSKGELSNLKPEDSLRYMVDALHPPPDAAIRLLDQRPLEATWFQPVYGNQKYEVFRIVSDMDLVLAEEMTFLAERALQAGDLPAARKRAMDALRYHWKYAPAQAVIGEVAARQARGH